MAWSDYGAFVWKNGKLINDGSYTDQSYYYTDSRWIKYNDLSDEVRESIKIIQDNKCLNSAGGHAVIPLDDDICISFLKTYGVEVHNKLETKFYSSEKVSCKANIKYNKDLSFYGFSLDSNEIIYWYEIRYKGDNYLVIVGSSVGSGFEKDYASKFILKSVQYRNLDSNREYYFKYRDKDIYPSFEMMDYYIRKDNIEFEKYLSREFDLKPLLHNLIRFRFSDVLYHLECLRERRLKTKYMK